MVFLGKNINLVLVVIILLVILLATGTTVLYQRGMSKRTSQYETTSSNLTLCTKALENYRNVLNKKNTQINETSQDIKKYDTLYGQKVAEITKKESDLKDTQQKLNSMTLQKEQFKVLYGQTLLNISVQKSRINDLLREVNNLKDDEEILRNQLSECQNEK